MREAREGRGRAVWRIAVYFLLLFLFLIAGQYAASVLPRDPLGWATWIIAAAGALAAGAIAITHLDGRPIGALGFPLHRHVPREVAVGLAMGGGLLAVAAILLFATGTAHFVSDEGTLPLYLGRLAATLVFFWIAAAAEELLFRGYAFQALVEAAGIWPAVLVSSAIFSWVHGSNPNVTPIAFANIFLAGVWLALVYLHTRSLWSATAAHAGWNWTMAALLDFPVSGLTTIDVPLYGVVETGADWYTGGAFGPEAGLVGTIALLLGLWTTRRLRPAPEMQRLRPLVDERMDRASAI